MTDITDPFGPPTVVSGVQVITAGTGKFAGAAGGCSFGGSSATDQEPELNHCEGALGDTD